MSGLMRRNLLLLAGCAVSAVSIIPAGAATYKLTCGESRRGAQSLSGTRFGKGDFGFDLEASPAISSGVCSSEKAFFVSVKEPERNYRITVELGGAQASTTTIKAESRRLMWQDVSVGAGKKAKRSFVVNVRTPAVSGNERVRLKPREIGSLDWDDKLTLEFAGDHPALRSLTIEPVAVPTIYLAGDSTVVDQADAPWSAWGQVLPSFFNEKIAVANEAESGETIHSFVTENRWDKIMSTMHSGDWLMIQFAHNDQKPGRGFVPISQYQDLLRHYIALARAKGAHPLLVTSMNRRNFNAGGRINLTLGGYPDAMRAVAKQERVPLIDLNAMSKVLFEAMGPDGTLKAFVHYPAHTFPNQPEPLADNTHFNSYGSIELAKCIVQSIRDQKLPLARYLRRGIPAFNPAHPDPPTIWNDRPDPFVSAQKPYER